jgi:hypothetical protein
MIKFKYHINRKLNTIFSSAEGIINIDDLIKQAKTIQANPEYKKGMNSLVDLSLAKPSRDIDFEKVNRYKEFIESVQHIRGTCKWAVVAPEDLVFGLSRMFEMLSGSLSIQTKVFRTEPEARKWLGISET